MFDVNAQVDYANVDVIEIIKEVVKNININLLNV